VKGRICEMPKTKEELLREIEEANAQLASLEKSEKEGQADPIEELMKAIEEFEGLQKSEDGDDDDKGGDGDGKGDGGGDGGGDDGDDKGTKKSLDDLEGLEGLSEELVKASEEYAKLCKSVQDFGSTTGERLDNLSARVDGVAGLMAGMSKAVVALAKSMKEFGEQPGAASRAHLGVDGGRQQDTDKTGTSKSEARMLLKKAIDDGDDVDPRLLGRVDVHGVGAIPEDIRAKYGIKLASA